MMTSAVMARHYKYMEQLKHDKSCTGTKEYKGLAYFWAHKYRFWMRGDAHANGYKGVPIKLARRRIHNKFIKHSLPISGETAQHDSIINQVFGIDAYTQEGV